MLCGLNVAQIRVAVHAGAIAIGSMSHAFGLSVDRRVLARALTTLGCLVGGRSMLTKS